MKPKPKTYALFLAKWREPIEALQLEPAERVALDDYIISRFIDDQPQPIDSLTGKAKIAALFISPDIEAIREHQKGVADAHIDALGKANEAKQRRYRGRQKCTPRDAYEAAAIGIALADAEKAHPDYDAEF